LPDPLPVFTEASFDPKNAVVEGEARNCDVVMKGGVTSGIVYPRAICHLATKYIIKDIGGTSVGAIAAVIAAAAEYSRQKAGSGKGYQLLSTVPTFLNPKVLKKLFAPDPESRDLLFIAMQFVGNNYTILKIASAFGAACICYWPVTLLAVGGLTAGFMFTRGWLLLGISFAVLAALLFAIAVTFVARAWYVIGNRAFGFCHAHSNDRWKRASTAQHSALAFEPEAVPPLMDWLYLLVQEAAGKPTAPLTFGDLWNPQGLQRAPDDRDRVVDFQMVTTCLTLGRPFRLPFDSTAPDLYFEETEFGQYFPSPLMTALTVENSPVINPPGVKPGKYFLLPPAEKLPVIIAVRLSMSFPILFCAVPLYGKDVNGSMQRVWFSDGGLTSNFPIHFFDSPLPRWPTFAIDLLGDAPASPAHVVPQTVYDPGKVFMEDEVSQTKLQPWDVLRSPFDYVMGIINTARGWQDSTLATLPGNRSRTVAMRLSKNEGGLNLNMGQDQINDLIRLGDQAGKMLVQKFAAQPQASDPERWNNHRWIRCRASLAAIDRWLEGFARSYKTSIPGQASYNDLPSQHGTHAPWPVANPADIVEANRELAKISRDWAAAPNAISSTILTDEPEPIAVLPTRPVV
jgi:predicted acylesterase/phospholipase RssA